MTRINGWALRTLSENIRFRNNLYLGYRSFRLADADKIDDFCVFRSFSQTFVSEQKSENDFLMRLPICQHYPTLMNECQVKAL